MIDRMVAIPAGSPLAEAMARRGDIMRLSQASHDAVIIPKAAGGLSHGLRATLAARMARQNGDEALAAHYDGCCERAVDSGAFLELTDPDVTDHASPRISAIVAHADMLTLAPRDATRAHIEALKVAGVEEADIVRLAELAAFVNYQARVVAGLRLLERAL